MLGEIQRLVFDHKVLLVQPLAAMFNTNNACPPLARSDQTNLSALAKRNPSW
jgi:hypothetical protein